MADPSRPVAWDRLELSVRRLMDDYHGQQTRLRSTLARVRELEEALEAFSGSGPSPIELSRRVEELEAENSQLLDRLQRARIEIERIMARLHFLEGR